MGCVIPHQSNAVNIPHQTNAGLIQGTYEGGGLTPRAGKLGIWPISAN